MTLANNALTANGVTRTYDGKSVVADASLTLQPGTVTALLGQSGAGKSTLLRLFAGLETPDAGEIKLGNTLLSSSAHMVPAEKRRIGLIFQDFALFPHLTVLENIMFGLSALPKNEAKAKSHDWLTQIGLQARATAYPHQLSGGEQQRIAIARALAPEPVAILMDEAFSGLDPALREDVRSIALSAIRSSGVPALLVTHDADEAMLSADQLAVMRDGCIIQCDTPETVYTSPVDDKTASALGPINLFEATISSGDDTFSTPFGSLSRPEHITSKTCKIGVRPENILIDNASGVKALIATKRRKGGMIQLGIRVNDFKALLHVPAREALHISGEIGVRLSSEVCIFFE